jgi:hypothetical protein
VLYVFLIVFLNRKTFKLHVASDLQELSGFDSFSLALIIRNHEL